MAEPTCSTCKHYQAAQLDKWGVCPLKELWPVRPQEVYGESHACAEKGSRWEPIKLDTPGEQRNSNIPSSTDQARPNRVWLFIGLGVAGLLLTVFVIAVMPAMAPLWDLGSIALIAMGVSKIFRRS